jgi:hypothetical protein
MLTPKLTLQKGLSMGLSPAPSNALQHAMAARSNHVTHALSARVNAGARDWQMHGNRAMCTTFWGL